MHTHLEGAWYMQSGLINGSVQEEEWVGALTSLLAWASFSRLPYHQKKWSQWYTHHSLKNVHFLSVPPSIEHQPTKMPKIICKGDAVSHFLKDITENNFRLKVWSAVQCQQVFMANTANIHFYLCQSSTQGFKFLSAWFLLGKSFIKPH